MNGLLPTEGGPDIKLTPMQRLRHLVVVALFVAASAAAGPYEEGSEAYKRGDYKAAAAIFRQMALRDVAIGQFFLGSMYRDGRGVPQDYAQALYWYRKAAEQGLAPAQLNLGAMYSDGDRIQPDFAQAVLWFRRAAEQGWEQAQFNLGIMFVSGLGVPKDEEQAYFWLILASVAGEERAVQARDRIEPRLTSAQRAAVQARARVWKAKSE